MSDATVSSHGEIVSIPINKLPLYTITIDFLIEFLINKDEFNTLITVIYKINKQVALILEKKI